MKIAINGFGRIGKLFFLACMKHKVNWDIIINHAADLDFIVYTLKYDSVHESPDVEIKHDGNNLIFDGKKFKVFNIMEAEKLPWKDEKVDLVVDCTGMFTTREEASKHLTAGAKRVLISAPAKGHDLTIVKGINDSALKREHKILSAGSCTTNCATPMLKVLNDAYKIKSAYFVTTHAYTSTQKLIDGVDKKDVRRGRAAAADIVPGTSGASQSVVEALPELKGKLGGYALRVPVADGSITSIVAQVEKVPKDTKTVNELFEKMSKSSLKPVLKYTSDEIVSADIIGNDASCTFDAGLTGISGNLVSIAGWYDNEWGYSNRLVDVSSLILKLK